MSPQARWEYMKSVHERYQTANGRKEKGLILTEFSKTYKCHRKSALRILNSAPPGERRPARHPRGSAYDSPRLMTIIEGIWKASQHAWGQRLKALIPDWLPEIRQQFKTTAEEERLLLSISGPTLDRKLAPKKSLLRRRIYGTTRPGRFLKHHIPIRTDNWRVDRPGYMEVDLVSHSGDCAEGDFAHSLNMTDIHTGWVERRCVLGKGQVGVQQAIDAIRRELPFPLLGIDSDNGSEFINDHLWRYSQGDAATARAAIQFTRGRPYKKDDNAHIEQKNWTHVRKLLGYCRYDTREVLQLINELYRQELRWFQNLFLPSQKLQSKERVGSKLRRRYDAPRTPLARVIASGNADPARLAQLRAWRQELNPFALSKAVDAQLDRIWAMRSKAPKPAWLTPTRKHAPENFEIRLNRGSFGTYERLLKREQRLQTW